MYRFLIMKEKKKKQKYKEFKRGLLHMAESPGE